MRWLLRRIRISNIAVSPASTRSTISSSLSACPANTRLEPTIPPCTLIEVRRLIWLQNNSKRANLPRRHGTRRVEGGYSVPDDCNAGGVGCRNDAVAIAVAISTAIQQQTFA